jgi:hypothetical protein
MSGATPLEGGLACLIWGLGVVHPSIDPSIARSTRAPPAVPASVDHDRWPHLKPGLGCTPFEAMYRYFEVSQFR